MYKILDMLDAEISSSEDKNGPKLISASDEKEVSSGFYPDQLGLFLWRLVPHIKEDFSGEQIQRLIRVGDSMAVGETREIPLMVTFRGRRTPLNVRIHKYDADGAGVAALALYVKTARSLASVIEDEIKIFFGPPTGEPAHATEADGHRRIHLQGH
jgi:hypothetical protein